MRDILDGLNTNQRSAVESSAEVLQVLAPPGSGKTKTLTARVAYLITHGHLRPWNIIVCTFTVKAAAEMRDRITNFVGPDVSKQLKLGTFHSVALRYLKCYGQHINLPNNFGIADTSDCKGILKRLIKDLDFHMDPGQALGRISSRKVKGPPAPDQLPRKRPEQEDFQRLFDAYEKALADSALLDYDDILLRCSTLLKKFPQCVSNVQAVLIDEFQDTNNIQYDLMTLFAQHRNVVTIVGDPDQSIYGFRAAEIKNLARMRINWPDTLTINLEKNYRSSGAILHAAQNIIEQDESRPPKQLQATHAYGLRPVLRKLPSANDEADWLVSEIQRLRAMSGNMLQPCDFAVLLRSAFLSRVIETALGKAGIPYRMVGGVRFYDRAEVKLIVDYLRVIHQPDNSEAVERIINVPSRKIGEGTVEKLRREADRIGLTMWNLVLGISQTRRLTQIKLSAPAIRGLDLFVGVILEGRRKVESWSTESPSLVELINMIAQKISLKEYLQSKYSAEKTYEGRWSNVEELMAQAKDMESPEDVEDLMESQRLPTIENLDQRSTGTEDTLSLFLANIALTASTERKADEEGDKVQQVTISTIHAAKGLEWPIVFIPACYDGSIPHSRSEDNDEERRLLYVGMTRAQALLYSSYPVRNTRKEETTISTFLSQPGSARFFEEHGPSLPLSSIAGLSATLKRTCPSEAAIAKARSTLTLDEDNHWPLNGEQAVTENRKWDHQKTSHATQGFTTARATLTSQSAITTMQQRSGFSTASTSMMSGFTSASARIGVSQEQSSLRAVDKRFESRTQAFGPPHEGRKRGIENGGGTAGFFNKKQRLLSDIQAIRSNEKPKEPLRDVSSTARNTSQPPHLIPTAPSHKPRSAPMASKPCIQHDEHENSKNYIFLSSSPPKSDSLQGARGPAQDVAKCEDQSVMRPATTLHNTSMNLARAGRKTLGMRRSLHGWSARRPG